MDIKGKTLIRAMKNLERLEGAGNARNRKLAILQNAKDNDALKWFFRMAYDWRITYGVSSPIDEPGAEDFPKVKRARRNWKRFRVILKKLSRREVTGNAAKDKLEKFFDRVSDMEAKWFSRVLDRDLGVGVQIGTYGKVWPDLDNAMAVSKGNTYEGQKLRFPIRAEVKADGGRFLVVIKNKKGVAVSSGGHDYTDRLQHIIKPLFQFGNGVYDGELLATWTKKDEKSGEFKSQWGKTQSMVKRGRTKSGFDISKLPKEWNKRVSEELHFRLFDKANLSAFSKAGNYTDEMSWKDRRVGIKKMLDKLHKQGCYVIEELPGKIVNNKQELKAFHVWALSQGYEGTMIKDLSMGYYSWRTDAMLKWKEDVTEDYQITGFEPGTGKNRNRLGAILFDNNGDNVKCGGGLKDDPSKVKGFSKKDPSTWIDRETIWKYQDRLLKEGWWIEVKYQKDPKQVAKNRFPRLVRLRHPDDINKPRKGAS